MTNNRLVFCAVLLGMELGGCTDNPLGGLYLGAPGTSETHAVVEVKAGTVTEPVWRIRSIAEVDGHTNESLLPDKAPSHPIDLPTNYVVVARNRQGVLNVYVEALAQDGHVVGRGRGSARLIAQDGVNLAISLGRACDTADTCQDGTFCNGTEQCVDGVCTEVSEACPPSTVSCVQVQCLEAEKQCNIIVDHAACLPIQTDAGPQQAYCEPATGCLPGRPDAPYLVADPVVTPAAGKVGTRFTVGFTVSEPLASDPVVRVDVGGRRVSMVVDESETNRSALHYVFSYTADGSELQGRRVMTVDLTDLAGTVAAGLSGGTLVLDFLAPALAGPATLTPTDVRAGVTATLDMTLTEEPAAIPAVVMALLDAPAGTTSFPWTLHSHQGTHFLFTYQAQGSETEGVHQVWMDAVDGAGNSTGPVHLGDVVLDFTAPSVVADPPVRVLPESATAGRLVTVEMQVSEDLAAPAQLRAVTQDREIVFRAEQRAGTVLTFLHTVEAGQDGVYDLVLDGLVDAAGNQRDALTVANVEFDTTAPQPLDVVVNGDWFTAAQTLRVSFRVNEPLGLPPQVRLGLVPLTRTGTAEDPFTFELPLVNTDLIGQQVIVAELVDRANNKGVVELKTVGVDSLAPHLLDSTFNPAVARLGITAYLSLTVSELLPNPPAITWQQDPGFVFLGRSGLTYTYALAVSDSTSPGVHRITAVDLTDLAGNITHVEPEAEEGKTIFTVDNSVPRVSGVTTNRTTFSAQPGFNTVELTFDVSEPPASAGATLEGVAMDCQASVDNPRHHQCQHTVVTANGSGIRTIVIQAVDQAGNMGSAMTNVVLDQIAPTLLSTTVSPPAARQLDTVYYTVIASEPLANPPQLHLQGAGPLSFQYSGTAYVFTHAVTAQDEDGTYEVAVDLMDAVGNRALDLPGTSFVIDAHGPIISALTTARDAYSARPGFNQLGFTFDCGEDVGSGLAVRVGATQLSTCQTAQDADCCTPYQATPPNHSCRYTVTGLEDEGTTAITVSATDAAGNMDLASIPVRFDFTEPTVVTGSESIQLLPAATLAISQVTKVTVDTKVRLGFIVTEPLVEDPQAQTMGPTVLPFKVTQHTGAFYVVEHTLAGSGHAQGSYSVQVVATDAVGNVGSTTLALPAPGLVIDTQVPAAPDVDTDGLIVHQRNPWGSQATAGQPTFTITGGEGAVEGPGTLLVLTAETPPWSELGRTQTLNDGNWTPLVLQPSDWSSVYVAFADEAGNLSLPAVRVRNGEWTATLYGKQTGSITENPHLFTQTLLFSSSLSQPGWAVTEPATADLAKVMDDDDAALGAHARFTWQDVRLTTSKPPNRRQYALAYDGTRGRTVLFGGDDGRRMQDTWEWDGRDWVELQPQTSPTARANHSLVHDSARGRVVLFGGSLYSGTKLGDTWEWDGSNWIQKNPPASPPARADHAMAYDSTRGVVVLFGGYTSTYLADTWEWDGTSWTQKTPAHSPPARYGHGILVFDEARQKMVLFGGRTSTVMNDTWEWDGIDWVQRTPATVPPARYHHGMAYDQGRSRIVLHAGESSSQFHDTWEWDGTNWTELTPASQPDTWWQTYLVYDRTLGRVVLMDLDRDTLWTWNGANWRQRTAPVTPTPVVDFATAWEGTTGRLLMFGGVDGSTYVQETWGWDGTNWVAYNPTTKPPARAGHAMAYDVSRKRTVLFGGHDANNVKLQDTWEWNGTNWLAMSPTTKPAARYNHAMAYTNQAGKIIMYGGTSATNTTLADTWEWNGTNWVAKTPSRTPGALTGHTMVYNPAAATTVLCKTDVLGNATWHWDGVTWTQVSTAHNPGWLSDPVHAYDPRRGRVVLYGGFGRRDIWEYSGVDWRQLNVGDSLLDRFTHMLTYDTERKRVIYSNGSTDARWEMEASPVARPAGLFTVDWNSARVDGAHVTTMVIQAVAGGRGYTLDMDPLDDGDIVGETVDGAALDAWDPPLGRWVELATNQASPDAPGTLVHPELANSAARRLISVRQGKVHLALRPVQSNGNGPDDAVVAVDQVEVTISYRR